MSDPRAKIFVMDELRVTATDFRVHFKDLGNRVARGGVVVVVERHGLEMVGVVNLDELAEFREWRRKERGGGKDPAKAEPIEAPAEHPDELPVEEVERIYKATGLSKDEWTRRWRGWAFISVKARTRRYPEGPPPL
jgi:hypothetical protein